MEIRVNLPENIYRSVTELAVRTSRGVDEVIADKLRDDFSIENIDNEELVAVWSDEDVLALANLKLPPKQDRRLSQLLERQRESRLTMNEKVELEGLMGLYNLANFRKSQGIVAAVKRGLLKTPDDLDE